MTATDQQSLDPGLVIEPYAPAQSRPVTVASTDPLERQGRRWIFGSFALCPCHLPLTLGILVTVFGGTAAGAVLRDHVVVAGLVISAAWVAGTWRGFRLVRLAQRGACPVPARQTGTSEPHEMTFGPAGPPSGQVQSRGTDRQPSTGERK